MKKRPESRNRTVALAAICAIALTALGRGNAAGEDASYESALRMDADFNAALGADYFKESRAAIENAFRTLDAEALEALLKRVPFLFKYTEAGGLESNNPLCHTFVDPDGNYGKRGKIIADYIEAKWKKNASTELLADDVVGMIEKPGICPNWRKFDEALRIKFWVWAFAAIAAIESTCGYHAYKPVVGQKLPGQQRTKYAIGLLQMELDARDRNWRSHKSCKVSAKEITQDLWNLRCGIDIMEWQLAGLDGRPQIPIYTKHGVAIKTKADYRRQSYWEKLNRPTGGEIGRLIRSFKPCFDEKLIPTEAPKTSPFGPFRKEYLFPIGEESLRAESASPEILDRLFALRENSAEIVPLRAGP